MRRAQDRRGDFARRPLVSVAEAVGEANKNPSPEPTCPTGKTQYSTWAAREALEHLTEKSQRYPGLVFPVRVYECPDCRAWHLTSRASSSPRNGREELKGSFSSDEISLAQTTSREQ